MYFSRARLLLRKKKHQETLLERTDKQLDNLEQLTHDIEFAQVERQVLDGLKSGNEALKAVNAIFSIEEIESIMDDTAEAVEKQREIDALLSGQGRVSDYFLGLICCNSSLSLWFKHIFG